MLNHIKQATNYTSTENGAVAYASTTSYLVDFFAQGGALRSRSKQDISDLFLKALHENPLYTMKALFYFRDIRGGQGERSVIRELYSLLANMYPDYLRKNLDHIPFYGRWDDLLVLLDTTLESDIISIIKHQLKLDMDTSTPSLLAKWLPSENTSSFDTRGKAAKVRTLLGLSPRNYRKMLSTLRAKINLVETQLSEKKYDKIDYSTVPSLAQLKYRQAFYRHDEARYAQFIQDVKKGDKVIKSATLYPYDIVNKILYNGENIVAGEQTLDAQWDSLPNYIGEQKENSIVVADVSGSMSGLPLCISISLAIYIAERNKGVYHNHFLTFSSRPKLQEIIGRTIQEKVRLLSKADWEQNTNISAIFDLLLQTAINNKIPTEEMVRRVIIISDMEFDSAVTHTGNTLFSVLRQKYQQAGYPFPNLVFWNVNARNQQYPEMKGEGGVQLVSGSSPSIMTQLLKGEFTTPEQFMLQVLSDPRYDRVTIS